MTSVTASIKPLIQKSEPGPITRGLPNSLLDRVLLPVPTKYAPRRSSDVTDAQDVSEVWFAGGHSDIGGGWRKAKGETWPLSHAPLVWMINEAEAAGLKFDAE